MYMQMTQEQESSYKDKLAGLSDEDLVEEIKNVVLAAGTSKTYGMFDAMAQMCYNEAAITRDKEGLYERGYAKAENFVS